MSNFRTNNKMMTNMRTFGIMLMALCFSCASSGKEESNQTPADQASWTITVTGKVGFPLTGKIVIQEMKEGGTTGWQDTIMLKSNYSYAKKIKMSEPGYYRISFYNKQNVDVILYKSNIEVNVDGNNPSGFSEVKGSPEIEVIRKAQEMLQETDKLPEVVKLTEEFNKANEARDQAKIIEIQQKYMKLAYQTNLKVAQYLKDQPASLAVINLLENTVIDRDQFFDTYVAVAEKLRKEWPNYTHAKNFVATIDKFKLLAVGQPAPEIALPNPEGQVVKLSSLRGKYVLVDFWAKWCGPCRKENPNVVQAYTQYKDKGFTVYGVSLDRSKDDWVKAIQEDGLTWTHVSDLKYWQSEAAKLYNINSIPFSLLLDKNGIIIAKNLRGPALEAKLSELLDGKLKP